MSDIRASAHQAVVDAVDLASTGDDAFTAAHKVAQRLPRAVLAFLAEAALVDQVRATQRRNGLAVERNAERRPRRGTRAYAEWVATPEGAEYDADLRESESLRDSAIFGAIQVALADYEGRLHVEWTAELLASPFALPDGSLTTWGRATIDQHERRRDIFLGNAHANLEGAARHSVAIKELNDSGCACLAELTLAEAMGRKAS